MGIKRRGGSVAPSRPAPAPRSAPAPTSRSQAPPPATTTNHHPPAPQQQHAPMQQPMHQQHPPMQQQPMMQQPMMQPPQQSGGFLSNVAGGIMNGMTFGVGSAVANRAVDSIMGPRKMEVVHTGDQAPQQQEAPAPVAQQSMQQPPSMMQQPTQMNNGKCGMEFEYYNRCMQINNNNLDTCSQYSQALQQCQRL